jgi:hypothetical protein
MEGAIRAQSDKKIENPLSHTTITNGKTSDSSEKAVMMGCQRSKTT